MALPTLDEIGEREEDSHEIFIDEQIRIYGKELTVYKYSSQPVGGRNRYGQVTPGFAAGVSVYGRLVLNPNLEKLSLQDNLQQVDVSILFSRLELVRKFPSAAEQEWIHEKDEVELEGQRYKLIKVKFTGRVKDRTLMVHCLGVNKEGKLRQ